MRSHNAVWVLAVCLVLALATAPPVPAADGPEKVTDEWCGFSLTVAGPWTRTTLKGYAVPGVLRCAWTAPGDSSLLVFVQEPGAAVDPRIRLDGSAAAQKANLGVDVLAQEVRTVGKMRAMWLALKGKGTGGALDGKGQTETVQHWVTVPRDKDVVVLLLTCPAADYERTKRSFNAAVESLKLSGSQTEQQKASR